MIVFVVFYIMQILVTLAVQGISQDWDRDFRTKHAMKPRLFFAILLVPGFFLLYGAWRLFWGFADIIATTLRNGK